MYIPSYYRNNNIDEVKKFIVENPFAVVITNDLPVAAATHLPLELVEEANESFLEGHLSRANPQWKNFEKEGQALAIFRGPHSYVSSGWYNHVNVPTWNYVAVHVSGKLRISTGTELYQSLTRLVDRYEKDMENPVKMESLPPDMIEKYLRGIVGFRISVDKIEGKWKMSQNRDADDHANIIRELEKLNEMNSTLVAAEMRRMTPSKNKK